MMGDCAQADEDGGVVEEDEKKLALAQQGRRRRPCFSRCGASSHACARICRSLRCSCSDGRRCICVKLSRRCAPSLSSVVCRRLKSTHLHSTLVPTFCAADVGTRLDLEKCYYRKVEDTGRRYGFQLRTIKSEDTGDGEHPWRPAAARVRIARRGRPLAAVAVARPPSTTRLRRSSRPSSARSRLPWMEPDDA